ncbi:MAG: hypothetical protein AB8G22_10310, partial [Saprospiraceae bacterium]
MKKIFYQSRSTTWKADELRGDWRTNQQLTSFGRVVKSSVIFTLFLLLTLPTMGSDLNEKACLLTEHFFNETPLEQPISVSDAELAAMNLLPAVEHMVLSGRVYVRNRTSCDQTVYCFEANGTYTGQTFNMGNVTAGGYIYVYPSATSGRVYCKDSYGTQTATVNFTGSYHSLYIRSGCTAPATTCTIAFKNTGCRTAELFWNDNGTLRAYGHIAAGATKNQGTTQGHKWVIKVGSTTVGNYTVNCSSPTYSFNAGGCNATCTVAFKNTGCRTAELFWNDNGTLRAYGHIAGGATKNQGTTNGHKWVIKVGTTTVGNYTVNCSSPSYSFDAGGRSVGGTVSPVNQTICLGTNSVSTLHRLNTGYVGTVVRWEYKAPSGNWTNWGGGGSDRAPSKCCFNKVGTWQVRAIVKNGSCAAVASAPANVKVNAKPDLRQFISVNGGGFQERNSVTVSSGSKVLLDFGGEFSNEWRFEFKRPDGRSFHGGTNGVNNDQILLPTVNDGSANEGVWKATYTDPNGCTNTENFTINVNAATCTVAFKNTGCRTAELFWNDNGTLRPYGHIAGGATKNQGTTNGHKWVIKVGTTTVGNYTVNCSSPSYSFDAGGRSVGGTVSPVNQTICLGTNSVSTLHRLNTGYVGTVVRWEYKPPSGNWTNWGGGGSDRAPSKCCFNKVGTWQVRAIVKNGSCAAVASAPAN